MFSLRIVSSAGSVFEGDVDFAVLPGSEGQLGVLPSHTPLLSTLRKGQIKARQKNSERVFDISGGFVEVLKNKVTVLIQ